VVVNLIEKNIDKILALCKQHKVASLFVFGSVLTKKFNANSDVDFVVDFKDVDINQYADNYYDFKDALENIFGRNVDLLEQKAIKNPFLKQSIDNSKQLIYG
jgi:uncharacterized protein